MLRKILSLVMVVAVISLAGCSGSSPSGSAPTSSAPATTAASQTTAPQTSGFPTRQIQIVAAYAAGGGVDINCRAISPILQNILGKPVVVANKPGASGALGFTYVGMADPDGYTVGLANIASMCSTYVLGDLRVDTTTGYTYLGATVVDPFLICVSKDSPYTSLKDVVEYLKTNPGGLSYGATGALSTDYLLAQNIEAVAGIEMNKVIFDGGSEALAALMGGHIQLMGGSFSETYSHVQDGEVKLIAVGGDERLPEQPDVATFSEQGFTVAFNAAKRAIFGPADMDPQAVEVLTAAIKQAVESDEFKTKCKEIGLQATYLTPEECVEEAKTITEFLQNNVAKK